MPKSHAPLATLRRPPGAKKSINAKPKKRDQKVCFVMDFLTYVSTTNRKAYVHPYLVLSNYFAGRQNRARDQGLWLGGGRPLA